MRLAPALLTFASVALTLVEVQGQADKNSTGFWGMSQDQRLLFIADFLASNEEITGKVTYWMKGSVWMDNVIVIGVC